MEKELKPTMRIVFTSFKESIEMDGLKLSRDRHAPKLCAYPTFNPLIMPIIRNFTVENAKRVCDVVLDNNWNLIYDLVNTVYKLNIHQLVLCCWCTKDQILNGKSCTSVFIGKYISDSKWSFTFPISVEYGDGRVGL